jgi:predicted DCC family thiol-disulfide oxidoreductase YuxK
VLGDPWHLLRAGAIVPERWRDAAYTLVARNRYHWFGKVEHCTLLTPEQRARLL